MDFLNFVHMILKTLLRYENHKSLSLYIIKLSPMLRRETLKNYSTDFDNIFTCSV